MADEQLRAEELQQSVMMAEQQHQAEANIAAVAVADGDVVMANNEVTVTSEISQITAQPEPSEADDDQEMHDAQEQNDPHHEEMGEGDDDAEHSDEGSHDGHDDHHDDHEHSGDEHGEEEEHDGEDHEGSDEDGEGDDGETVHSEDHTLQPHLPSVEEDHEDHEDDDDDEGVGAVKIKPGDTDHSESESEEEDDHSSASSASVSDAESEDETHWEDAAEHEPAGNNDDDDDDDEGSDKGDSGLCMFCKQDEDHDPAEEFEEYLACSGCGENAHQQCAREANALASDQAPDTWKCPNCAGEGSQTAGGDIHEPTQVNGTETTSHPTTRRSSAPKLARDLLPPQKNTNPDSHSVFNQLVLDDDPMDGSRVLRKRKTSSVEPTEHVISLRKRRRNTVGTEEEPNDSTAGNDEQARPTSARSLRIKISNPSAPASIVKKTRSSIVLRMRVDPTELQQILSQPPKGTAKRSSRSARSGGRSGRSARSGRKMTGRSGRSRRKAAATDDAMEPSTAPFASTSYTQPFYSFYDKETDELKGKPYGGILTDAEADTSKTLPQPEDRRRFDEAKQMAEEEWRQRLVKMQAEVEAPVKKSKKNVAPASQIECIEFGGWEIDTWYAAPYPEEYSRNRVLYICEFCLKYMSSDYVAWRHKLKCPAKHPPGDEIYRHGSISVFEVDGRKNPVYCQNLCLLAKLFLGSKTLYYDVEPFLFYVLCEYDPNGYHFVGYFSKEKRASSQNNVSCILTLPIHQRKGYGNLLIDFSYLLTRVEQKTGSPEKPLSDMGLVSYRNYWRLVMCKYLLEHCPADPKERKGLSIKKISDDTGLTPDDVISSLEGLRCLVRDPQTQIYAFRVDLPYCKEYVAKWEAKNYVQLEPKALTWTPYVMGRSNATNFELGPPLNAIAAREDDESKPTVAPGAVVNGEASQPDGLATQVQKMEIDTSAPTILESTEPNELGDMEPEVISPRSVLKTSGLFPNGSVHGSVHPADDHSRKAKTEDVDGENKENPDDWMAQYEGIPPTRFEVVPAINTSRRGAGADRTRNTVPRPPAVRTNSASAARPRNPRRTSGAARRTSTAAKPRSSSSTSKRKAGGTGRGPGRWPKGTKKSDYGNAESGPGFPPGWLEKQKSLGPGGVTAKKEGEEEGVKDTVHVTPQPESVAAGSSSAASGSGTGSKSRSASKSTGANGNGNGEEAGSADNGDNSINGGGNEKEDITMKDDDEDN
ncbi:hypothetical protein B0T20DRAFT_390084 [Sordaria brevicollis]|uniref:Histone acetyltransferase n=1 Tax=Sordaria brevicollis TaxID=83679 RepID=A0AAE0UFI7_SORBR|nr:hypothetical protein B0T20DRAFT_390084 [Sordaria brevicollis]